MQPPSQPQIPTPQLLFAAIENAVNSIVITDTTGTIQWVNRAFSVLTGYSRADAAGQTLRRLNPDGPAEAWDAESWKTSERPFQRRLRSRRKDGSEYIQEVTIEPVYGEAGFITHFVVITQDITARHDAERALRESREVLDLAMQTDSQNLWDWSLVTSEAYVSIEGHEFRISIPIPDHTAEVLKSGLLDRNIRTGAATGRPYQAEIRIRHKHGGRLWLSLERR